MQPIYLDYNATTPLDPAVVAAMRPYLEQHFGNPSSSHAYGQAAKEAHEQARGQVAALLGCAPDEVIFTSGGSESDNQAIKGIAFARSERGKHIITSQIEHPAVLNTCRYLEMRHGFEVTYLPVDGDGLVDPAMLEEEITPQTILITLMHANNEVGTLEPLAEIGRMARRHGIVFHTDAAQSVGKVPVNVEELGVDLLTVVGHKLYAPKGVGALYIRRGTTLDPLIHGAGHEGGRRAGTENVPYAVALGTACALAGEQLAVQTERWLTLRQRLLSGLEARVGPVKVSGHPERRLPNTLNICVPGVVGEEVLARAPGVAASTGSACHAGLTEPSPVLLAMGIEPALALGALRLSLGRWTTAEEVDLAVEQLSEAILALRNGAQPPILSQTTKEFTTMGIDVSSGTELLHPELEAYRAEFPILQRKTYLNSCSLGALSERSMDGLSRFVENWNDFGAHAWYKLWLNEIAAVKEKFARIIGAKPTEVAIAPSVSAALSELTSALDFSQRNKVVMADMDFPTLAYQWLVKQRLGVEVDFVESPDHIHVPPELLIDKIDENTALVATSRVFFTSGYIQDVAAVTEAAHRKGAYVLIDDYQGTGLIPIDVHALDIDFLVTGTLKWLMGGPGLALVYVREELIPKLEPTMTGWFAHREQFKFDTQHFQFRDDAGRFESGTPSVPTIHTANGGMEIVLEIGVQRIYERTRALTNDLVTRIKEKGWTLRSPEDEHRRSAIVMLALDQPADIVEKLVEQRFITDHRPGLLRISPYFYNTVAENEAIVEAISRILAART